MSTIEERIKLYISSVVGKVITELAANNGHGGDIAKPIAVEAYEKFIGLPKTLVAIEKWSKQEVPSAVQHIYDRYPEMYLDQDEFKTLLRNFTLDFAFNHEILQQNQHLYK